MRHDETKVPLLDAAPDLGNGLDASARHAASMVRVRVAALRPGPWNPAEFDGDIAPLGLMVVSGALARTVAVGGRRSIELLGEGDVLWPWDDEALEEHAGTLGADARFSRAQAPSAPSHPPNGSSLATATSAPPVPEAPAAAWSVLSPAGVALLDARVAALGGRVPALAGELVARAARRARALTAQMAIAQVPRVDARVLAFLWHVADRHGRVRPDGVLVPLPLTHEVLAGLVGARRPSVTTALGELGRRGAVSRVPDGWLLLGARPTSSS